MIRLKPEQKSILDREGRRGFVPTRRINKFSLVSAASTLTDGRRTRPGLRSGHEVNAVAYLRRLTWEHGWLVFEQTGCVTDIKNTMGEM